MNPNSALQRQNMISNQLFHSGIASDRLLALYDQLDRRDFVPAQFRPLAYGELTIPIGEGEMMLTPLLEAKLIQALNLESDQRVLVIGTGSGFTTALIARLVAQVISIEIHPEIAKQATTNLANYQIDNVQILVDDGFSRMTTLGEFSRILLTGSVLKIPDACQQTLEIGGIMVATVGAAPAMSVTRIARIDAEHWHTEALFETTIQKLKIDAAATEFNFS